MIEWYNFPEDIEEVLTEEGVYFLSETNSEDGIIYIGRADNLRERLSDHPDTNNLCLQRKNIKYFAYEETSDSEKREEELIGDYDPDCNRTN